MLTPTKITNAAPGSFVSHEYSSINPWSLGNAYLLLIHQSAFALYSGDGKFLKDLHIGASERPRWSRKDSAKLTYLRHNQVVIYDVNQGILDSYIFDEYGSLDDGGEADQQGDSRVLVGTKHDGGKEMFVLDVVTGSRGPVVPNGPLNNVLLCPDGQVLIDGKLLWNPKDSAVLVIAGSDSHKAVGRDTDGRAILVRDNSNDRVNPENKHRIMKVPLDGSVSVVLLELPWNLATHTSLCDNKFALVTTYDPTRTDVQDPLDNTILRVPLDGSGEVDILCRHGSDSSTYAGQPKAAISQDGSRFVYASNSGDPAGPVDTWLCVLAAPQTAPEPTKPPVVWPGPPYSAQDRWWSRFWAMMRNLFGGRG